MKAHLMFPDRDFDMSRPLPPQARALIQDIELTTLFAAMARDDKWLAGVVRTAVLSSMTDVETILYRQPVLEDCLARDGKAAKRLEPVEGRLQDIHGAMQGTGRIMIAPRRWSGRSTAWWSRPSKRCGRTAMANRARRSGPHC